MLSRTSSRKSPGSASRNNPHTCALECSFRRLQSRRNPFIPVVPTASGGNIVARIISGRSLGRLQVVVSCSFRGFGANLGYAPSPRSLLGQIQVGVTVISETGICWLSEEQRRLRDGFPTPQASKFGCASAVSPKSRRRAGRSRCSGFHRRCAPDVCYAPDQSTSLARAWGHRDREAAPLLKRLLTRPAHCHINAGTNGAHGV